MRSDFNNISSALDATDLQLLANLQADASISNIALADKLRISAATCLRRTKRLLQEGWIEKQVAILSSDKLGQLPFSNVGAYRPALISCWWCKWPTCQRTWLSRKGF